MKEMSVLDTLWGSLRKERYQSLFGPVFSALGFIVLVGAFVLGVVPGRVAAAPQATITVTNLNDSGSGSLRQAIADANAGDMIEFAPAGTILLSTELVINQDLTINGGNSVTVSGNNATRVFNVTGGNVTFDGLTIADGRTLTIDCGSATCGGGIKVENNTAVTVTNSSLVGNDGGQNGGGIYNNGTLTVMDSTLADNTAAGNGGGIHSGDGTTIINTTFINNQARQGGGVYYSGDSGSCADPAGLTIYQTTFSGNVAVWYGGGISNGNGVAEITHTTITDNSAGSGGGGLSSFNDSWTCTRVGGTIISANDSTMSRDIFASYSDQRFDSLGYNLIGSGGGSVDFNLEFNQSSDQTDVIAPLLAPLADNGGGLLTHLPRPDSPAVDGGNCTAGPTTDQRGQARPQNILCDIGATELQAGEEDAQVCGVVPGGVYTLGASGVQIEIDTAGTLDCLTVDFTNATHPQATSNIPSPYVDISTTPAVAAGFQVTVTMPHDNYADPQLCRYTGGAGAGWDCGRSWFDAQTVVRGGVTDFSDWAVGNNVGPTAVTLQSSTADSGGPSWLTMAAAVIMMVLTAGVIWSMRHQAATG